MHTIRWLYDPHDEERRVGWLELFFDLVFVATLIELGNLLSGDVSVGGFIRFACLLAPVWWVWTGTTFFANRFLVDDVTHRILVFIQIYAMAGMALSIEGVFGDLAAQFTFSYVIARIVLISLYARSWQAVEETRPLVGGYMFIFTVGTLFWIASFFVEGDLVYALWAAGLIFEVVAILSPYMIRWQFEFRPHIEHMVERYGIFTIIVLGESFLKVIDNFSGQAFEMEVAITSIFTTGLACAIWWLYFDDISASEINEGRAPLPTWIFFHLPVAIGITAFGVAAKKILEQPFGDPLSDKYRLLMVAALAVYLIAVAIIDEVTSHGDRSNKSTAIWRFAAALVIIAIGLFATELKPLHFTVLVFAVFVTQVVEEIWTNNEYQKKKREGQHRHGGGHHQT